MRIPRKLRKCMKYDDGFMGTLLEPTDTGLPFAIMCILNCVKSKYNKPRFYVFLDNNYYMEDYKQPNLACYSFNIHNIKSIFGKTENEQILTQFVISNYNILMNYWNQKGDSSILYNGIQRI